MSEDNTTIKIKGTISTNNYGLEKLIKLYFECNQHTNITITFCFKDLIWIDANMAAIFSSLILKLEQENNLKFFANIYKNTNDFKVLFNNGFFTSESVEKESSSTTIKLRSFNVDDNDEFVSYIENDFLNHEGLSIEESSKDMIIDCLIEIFNNYEIHSESSYPIFLCGQYYPTKRILKFTISDLGIGFLKPIKNLNSKIETYEDAINWALVKGHSTKMDGVPGGLGLNDLRTNLLNNNGQLEIISGNAYKICSINNGIENDSCKTLNINHIGTTINLFFNYN